MQYSLMQSICNYIFENRQEFNLTNSVTTHFRDYIFDDAGEYLEHGGKQVSSFILRQIKLVQKYSQELTDEQL